MSPFSIPGPAGPLVQNSIAPPSGDPPGLSPDLVSGLVVWHDAADESTLTVTSSPDVDSWSNKAPSPVYASLNSTSASASPHTGASVNGRNALSFNGTSQFMRENTAAFTDSPFTIFVVGSVANTTGFFPGLFVGDKDVTNQFYVVSFTGSTPGSPASLIVFDPGAKSIDTTTGFSANRIHMISVTSTTPTSHAVTLDAGGAVFSSIDLSPLNVDRTSIGVLDTSAPALFYSGTLCEIVVFGGTPSTEDLSGIQVYLANKWGITLSGL